MASLREMSLPAQLGVAFVIAVVLLAGGYYGVLNPMVQSNKDAQDKLDAQLAQNAQLRHYKQDLPQLEASIASLELQVKSQAALVPDEKEVDQFMHIMQDTAQAAGVEVRRYTVKPTATHDYYVEQPFDMDIDGPYYSVVTFFKKAAGLDRIINISNVKLATPKRQSDTGAKGKYDFAPNESVVASITATTFYAHTPTAPAAAPNAAAPGAAPAAAPATK
jgi:type IV pilus assembly protein PilO